MAMVKMNQPLNDICVIEFGASVAGAACTKTFSDYGARVIKVEPYDGGKLRRIPPFKNDVPNINGGAFHLAFDSGKESIVVDFSSNSGLAIIKELYKLADLVIYDLPPTKIETLQLVLDKKSGPSTVSITPHGLQGPYKDRLENDSSTLAWTTRMYRNSIENQQPLRNAPESTLVQIGHTAAAVGIGIYWGHQHDNVRRDAEVAGVEAVLGNVDTGFVSWVFTGNLPQRIGGQLKTRYPTGIYPCKNGYIVLSANEEPWFSRLCNAIGHPEILKDKRFTEYREDNWEAFMTYLGPYLKKHDKNYIFTHLQEHGVMVAPVLNASDLLNDPQAIARKSFIEIKDDRNGNFYFAGAPFHMNQINDRSFQLMTAPELGMHTNDVLSEIGYSANEIIALFRAGVVG